MAKKIKFIPNKGSLLIRRAAEKDRTKNGLFIPDAAKELTQDGVVIATHPENAYKIGDHPLFGKYAGTDIPLNDEVLLLLPEEQVLGLLVEV